MARAYSRWRYQLINPMKKTIGKEMSQIEEFFHSLFSKRMKCMANTIIGMLRKKV
jgi:hypothetical protein